MAFLNAASPAYRPLARGRRRGALALAVCLAAVRPAAGAPASLENAVKAAYIYKFAPFVSWPGSPGATFVICTSGADPVTALLGEVVAGQQVDGRPIAVRSLGEAEAPAGCQILYVANSPAASAALAAARGKPILTVTPDTVADHSVIRLSVIDQRVRFDVDARLAADDGLAISSKLLNLAHAVTPASQVRE
ncbi:MAG TPA: YfiR family protein [Rhizomicrobium sp.]